MNPSAHHLTGLALLVGAASSLTCLIADPEHCAHRAGLQGHDFCQEQFPDFPLCSRCETAESRLGCTDRDVLPECLVGSSPPDEPVELSTSSTSDAAPESTGSADCEPADCEARDSTHPLCNDQGQCVPCTEAGGNEACSAATPDRSVCLGDGDEAGRCVQCTETSSSACSGPTPTCDAETNECIPCSSHAQCLTTTNAACHIETGECLPADRVWHVDRNEAPGGDGTEDAPYRTIAAALEHVGPRQQGTIILHEATQPYAEAVTIDGDRVLAIVAAPDERPTLAADAEGGLVSVDGPHTIAYLEGLAIRSNTTGPALRITAASAYVDRCELTGSRGGIELAIAGQLWLRNGIVSTAVAAHPVLSIDHASADVVYSTIVHTGTGIPGFDLDAVRCSDPYAVTVRNSVVLSRGFGANGWLCPEAILTHTAGEDVPPGNGNVRLCDVILACSMDAIPSLFTDLTSLRLSPIGADLLADIPELAEGDPPHDVDLNPRTATHDFAGAHAPP